MAKSRSTLDRDAETPREQVVSFEDETLGDGGAGRKRGRRISREREAPLSRHRVLAGLIVAFFLVVFLAAIALGYQVDTFLATDSRFMLAALMRDGEIVAGGPLEIAGAVHTPLQDVVRVFERDSGRSLYLLPLGRRLEELKAIDWVKSATVSRIWPNRLRVVIEERVPVAIAGIAGAKAGDGFAMKLVDAEGQLMRMPVKASYNLPVVFGLHPDQPIEFRAARIQLLMRMQQEVEPLEARFSELYLNDSLNLRATLVLDGRNLTLLLGSERYLIRVQKFLDNYEAILKEDPLVNLFDLQMENRVLARREGLSGV